MNTVGYFEIQSSKIEQTIAFYQHIFNWKFIREHHVPIEYYRIETNGIHGGLLKRPADILPKEFGTNAFTCSIQVESFDNTAKMIIDQGGAITIPKFAIPTRCWQGYFTDPDHNIFGIFEVDELAR